VPQGIVKEIKDITDRVKAAAEEHAAYVAGDRPGIIAEIPREDLLRMVKELEGQMKAAARDLEFEKAALLRDQIIELRRITQIDPVIS
jgi:excinuclease ABC subunit B